MFVCSYVPPLKYVCSYVHLFVHMYVHLQVSSFFCMNVPTPPSLFVCSYVCPHLTLLRLSKTKGEFSDNIILPIYYSTIFFLQYFKTLCFEKLLFLTLFLIKVLYFSFNNFKVFKTLFFLKLYYSRIIVLLSYYSSFNYE